MIGAARIQQEILNSLRFYYMLAIVLSEGEEPESVSCQSLKSYLEDIRKDHYISEEVLIYHMNKAYQSLPTEFLRLHRIEVNPDDRHIKIVEEYHAPSGRSQK